LLFVEALEAMANDTPGGFFRIFDGDDSQFGSHLFFPLLVGRYISRSATILVACAGKMPALRIWSH
jgi:hypothetical protein